MDRRPEPPPWLIRALLLAWAVYSLIAVVWLAERDPALLGALCFG